MATPYSRIFGGGGDATLPTLGVQDVKIGSTGGGFYGGTSNVWRTRDLNFITQNTIDGASLTTSGSITGTDVGYVDANTTSSIINNNSGDYQNYTHVTLPAGDYKINYSSGITVAGISGHSYTWYFGKLYNKTTSSDIIPLYCHSNSVAHNGANYVDALFTLDAQSDIDLQVNITFDGTLPNAKYNLGGPNLGTPTEKWVFTEATFTKLS